MSGRVKAVPDGFHSVTPFLTITDAARAVEFYKHVFAATERIRETEPSGKLSHAEIKIGDSLIMLTDDTSEHAAEYAAKGWSRSPRSLGGTAVALYLYVEDVDAVFNRAVAAGAQVRELVKDRPWGDRMAGVEDPFGHVWYIATRKEDLSPEALKQRAAAQGKG